MAHPLRVLFYDDAPDFGGHELQTLAAVRHIASQPNTEVAFVYFRGNARLSKQIADLAAQCPGFKAMPQDYASRSFQFLRTLLSGRAIRRIAATMAGYAPDVLGSWALALQVLAAHMRRPAKPAAAQPRKTMPNPGEAGG